MKVLGASRRACVSLLTLAVSLFLKVLGASSRACLSLLTLNLNARYTFLC